MSEDERVDQRRENLKGEKMKGPSEEREKEKDERVVDLIEELKQLDSRRLLDSSSEYSSEPLLSSLRHRSEHGAIQLEEMVSEIRGLCEKVIWRSFSTDRDLANHADDLLDHLNDRIKSINAPCTSGRPIFESTQKKKQYSVHEYLRISFNPGLLKVRSNGNDAGALLLVANQMKKKSGKCEGGRLRGALDRKRSRVDGYYGLSGKNKRIKMYGDCNGNSKFDGSFQKLLSKILRAFSMEMGNEDNCKMKAEFGDQIHEIWRRSTEKLLKEASAIQIKNHRVDFTGTCIALDRGLLENVEAILKNLEKELLSKTLNPNSMSPIITCTSTLNPSKPKTLNPNSSFSEASGTSTLKPTTGVGLEPTIVAGFLRDFEKIVREFRALYLKLKNGGNCCGNFSMGNLSENLPETIRKNTEPYYQGDWRREPYEVRPYERLTTFEVREDPDIMATKLQTTRCDGCSTEFYHNHREIEEKQLIKHEKELINAVKERKVLNLDSDIKEVDTWGLDCYTRKNIHDAVVESGAFGLNGNNNGSNGNNGEGDRDGRVAHWVERVLMPIINQQGAQGWDLQASLDKIITSSRQTGDLTSLTSALSIQTRLQQAGYSYFRVHPKGQGVVCIQPNGLPPFTFVEEYLGVLHTPWRWFEIQDVLKKYTGDDVPDFYNIILERPKDDPDGYDVLFVDAASKGSVASRMSHSCNPNCQAVVVSCSGRLTIVVYTLRYIQPGEELTFDYSSVTESEKEYRAAICLCGTFSCRGSYLYYGGSSAFMQVMNTRHTFLHRNAVLLRSGIEGVTANDKKILDKYGLGRAAFGTEGVDKVPNWVEKWTALILEYVEKERELLPVELMRLPEGMPAYTKDQAEAQARGVSENRLQNIVITLDKIRLSLRQLNQPQTPPLTFLSDSQILDYLWLNEKSIAKRCVRALLPSMLPSSNVHALSELNKQLIEKFEVKYGGEYPFIVKLCRMVTEEVGNLEEARRKLMEIVRALREEDMEKGGGHTACADVLYLYANTKRFFTPEKNYKGFTTEPLGIPLHSISGVNLKGGLTMPSSSEASSLNSQDCGNTTQNLMGNLNTISREGGSDIGSQEIRLCKKYSVQFIWGQLVMWFKQTVNDPTASLSADRRGTLSLPDIESCYEGGKGRYTSKDRGAFLDHIENRPEAMWKLGSIFSFRNELKVYGSPMFDAVWDDTCLKEIVRELREADVPKPTIRKHRRRGG